MTIRHISPQCKTHSHADCRTEQKDSPLRCECICHKLVGE